MNVTETQHEMHGQRITIWCETRTYTVQFTALISLVGTDFFLVFRPERFDIDWNEQQRDGFVYEQQQTILADLENMYWDKNWFVNWVLKLNPNGEHSKLELWED